MRILRTFFRKWGVKMIKQHVLISIKRSNSNASHNYDIVVEINDLTIARFPSDSLGDINSNDFQDKYMRFVRDVKMLIQYSESDIFNILEKQFDK